jgi:hypothetical protein
MLVLEIVAVVVILVLAAGATWMAVVGLVGVASGQRLKRCRSCGHLLTTAWRRPPSQCPVCRHPWLASHVMPVHLVHMFPSEMEPDPRGSSANR